MLSEQAPEAANKTIKKFESSHSRLMSYELALKDTFYRMMHRSDPIIQVSTSYSADKKFKLLCTLSLFYKQRS